MATRYPGAVNVQRRSLVALAVLLALLAGAAAGRAFGHGESSTTSVIKPPVCPGSRTSSERTSAAACLLDRYLAAGRMSSSALRNFAVRGVPQPNEASKASPVPVNEPGQPASYARVAAQYESVVAVKPGADLQPDAYEAPDVGFSAWVVEVAAFDGGHPPLANWYLGHFAVRWEHGRWWLSDGFRADRNATPTSFTGGNDTTAFGPGWVAS